MDGRGPHSPYAPLPPQARTTRSAPLSCRQARLSDRVCACLADATLCGLKAAPMRWKRRGNWPVVVAWAVAWCPPTWRCVCACCKLGEIPAPAACCCRHRHLRPSHPRCHPTRPSPQPRYRLHRRRRSRRSHPGCLVYCLEAHHPTLRQPRRFSNPRCLAPALQMPCWQPRIILRACP